MDELNRVQVRCFLIFVCLAGVAKPTWAGVDPQPLPAYSDAESLRGDSSLTAVAFADPRFEAENPGITGTGIAVGDRGAVYRTTDEGQTWNAVPSPVDCQLKDVIWMGARYVIVVGGAYDAITQLSRGVVLVSRDAGSSFQQIKDHDLPLLRNLRLSENRLLVADGDWSHSQLSKTFLSRDVGRMWQGTSDQQRSGDQREPGDHSEQFSPTHSATADSQIQTATSFIRWQRITGSPAPVRDACRIAGDRLCAVGDHGLILTSEDNGESWIPRRGGDRHAAILFVAGDAQSASWSLLGSESLQWRHRCALLVEQPSGESGIDDATDNQRSLGLIRQAAVMLGAASVDWFRGPDELSELDELSEQTNLQARRWIAVHRPSVVVIDESVTDETRQAVFQAATSMGVRRVLKSSRKEHGGSLLHHSALLPRIGSLAADLILDAQHLVAPGRCEIASLSLTRLYDSGSSRIGGGGESIMAGLTTNRASQLSGTAKSISRHRLQVVQARTKQTRLIEKLVDVETSSPADFEQSLRLLMDQTATEDQLRMIWMILDQTRGTQLEDVCLREIAERFSNGSIGKWASVRIDAYQTSAEQRLLSSKVVETTEIVQAAATQAATVALSPFQNQDSESDQFAGDGIYQQDTIRQASAFIPVGVARPEIIQASPISQNTQPTSSVDLQLDLHPAVMLSRLETAPDAPSATSQQVEVDQANAPLMTESINDSSFGVTATTLGDICRIALQGTADWKRLLANTASGARGNSNELNHSLVRCADSPPRLDGKLNDPCWDIDTSAFTQGNFRLTFAADQNYLYVAAVCPSDAIAADLGQRSIDRAARDQLLSDVDRLRLRFDTDGDLWTSHSIEVTDSGRTRDSVDGDTRWQPTWYVDVDRTAQTVTFEIAIRRSDLAGDISDTDARWFVSAQAIRAGQEIAEPLFPCPSHWRSVSFEQPTQDQRPQLRPAGPVRLAPVETLR